MLFLFTVPLVMWDLTVQDPNDPSYYVNVGPSWSDNPDVWEAAPAQLAGIITGAAAVPVNMAAPVISGAAQVGQTLAASTGTWTNSPTGYTYQWNRGVAAISGATTSTYVPVAADVGTTLTVSMVATNSEGASSPTTSAPTSAVIAATAGVTIASLTAHNTSAYANYDQSHIPANFGTTSNVNQTQTVTIDPAKLDRSMNPVTPGHVSRMDVHSLIPNRPDLRWFVHLMAGWWGNGQPTNAATSAAVNIGYTENTDAYVAALIQDLVRRGFNGVFCIWNGIGSPSDQVAGRIKTYIAANLAGKFTYAIMIDEGLVIGSGNMVGTLETAVNYLNKNYFGDPNYEKEGTKAYLPMYGVGDQIGDTGMNTAKAAVGSTSVWGQNTTAHINQTWSDFTLDWVETFNNYQPGGFNPADPYNLSALNGFYTAVAGVPGKKAMGAMTAGFNGTLTGAPSWSLGKYFPQNSGAAMVQRAAFINTNIPRNVTRMQWATWNDYPEGSAVEPGIENNVTVTASVQGSTLNWTYTSGTGDESTIDHYDVYASSNGTDATYLGTRATGLSSFPLGSSGLSAGTPYTIMVVAVGKPCIRDHISNSASYTPASGIPVNTAVPTISGTAQVGQPLTASNGTWTNSPASYAYQWYRSGILISGAGAATYIPFSADVGSALTVWVTATNGSGSSSPASSAVIDIIPTNTVLPAVTGTAQVGQTLTASTGTWTHSPTSYAYQWRGNGTNITGAMASTHVPVAGDVGHTLTASVVATNSGGSSTAAVSAATAAAVPVNTYSPYVYGRPQVGNPLHAIVANWTNSPTSYTYQWTRNEAIIPGATSSQYICVAADKGTLTGFIVTAYNAAVASQPYSEQLSGA